MFTGIVETIGLIVSIEKNYGNTTFGILSKFNNEVKIDQSIAHNGVCLTVELIVDALYYVTAIKETLNITNLKKLKEADEINLERALLVNDRLDGHFVQGHVDCTAKCIAIKERKGSWEMEFEYPEKFANLLIEKGSICINGVSLTCFNITNTTFCVAIIPFTFKHTMFKELKINNIVNIEFDLIGKYFARSQSMLVK